MALICFPEFNVEDVAVYPYLMSVSAGFLLVTFVVYASISQLRNLFGVIVMSYSISLAVMFICLATIKLATQSVSDSTCIVLGKNFLPAVHCRCCNVAFLFHSCHLSLQFHFNLHLAECHEFQHLVHYQVFLSVLLLC